MKRLPKFLLSAAMVATMATSFSAVMAATPPDTLVQAWQIDDIISLDPAEVVRVQRVRDHRQHLRAPDRLRPQGRLEDLRRGRRVLDRLGRRQDLSPSRSAEGAKFASGNPITAEDVVFSLQRAVTLDKSPAFILGQFGLTKDNVEGQGQADRPARVHLRDRQGLRADLRPLLPDRHRRLGRRQEAGRWRTRRTATSAMTG